MDEKKYLDADHLLTALSVFNDHDNGNPHFLNGIRTAEEIIKDAPTADVRPVKRGEWKETMEPMGWTEEACAECSVCGETFVLDEYAIEDIQREFKFCPNCGADMRPVTDDGQ